MDPIVTEHTLINNNRIAYGTRGDGEPVVLLHGTPSSSLIWRNNIPCLVHAGFKTHFYDLLGFGLSERPWDPDTDTSMTGQVPILEGMLDLWGLDTFHLVAHDIGGGIAQRFATAHPERIRSLTLIDVVCFDSYPSKRTREQMKNGLEAMMIEDHGVHRAHFREWLLSAVQHGEALGQSSLDTYVNYISGPIGQPSLFQHQVRHYDPKHTMEVVPQLYKLESTPVQIIWGIDDAWQVVEWGKKLHNSIPGSQLHILNDCGHFSPEDQPAKISQLVTDFLEKNSK